jgi:threonine dehydratase
MNAVAAAAHRIAGGVRRTPVLTSAALDRRAGCTVYFKSENLQWAGAFKMRGALNAVLARGGSALGGGVATHSSGNHGAALARAARTVGIAAHVVMPHDAPAFKRANVRRFGGIVHDCGPMLAEREQVLACVVEQTGAVVIAPYDDDDVIAGQGTAVLEFLHQVPGLAEIWVPVGGGGLAAGAVLAVATHASVRIVGAEPELADDAARSLASGVRQPQRAPTTVADGLRTALGERNFAILQRYRLPIVLVDDDEILAAQSMLIEHLGVIVEPSSAVPFAGLLKMPAEGRLPTGIVLTGGNFDVAAPIVRNARSSGG